MQGHWLPLLGHRTKTSMGTDLWGVWGCGYPMGRPRTCGPEAPKVSEAGDSHPSPWGREKVRFLTLGCGHCVPFLPRPWARATSTSR